MTAIRIDGRALAEKVRAEVAEDVRAYGGPVCLATILVGDDPASHTYVGSKHKASHEAGIDSRDHRFPADTAEATVLELIDELNADDGVDGILVQLPLPDHMDEPKVLRAVDPEKDVDGFHVLNAGTPLPRRAVPRAGDAFGRHGDAGRSRSGASRARRRS